MSTTIASPPVTFNAAKPTDDLAWGKLAKSWSTGLNYVDGSLAPFSPPPGGAIDNIPGILASLPQFNAAAVGGASVIFPPDVTEIVFVQDTKIRRYVRLPEKRMVLAAETDIKNGGTYELPKFYLADPLDCNPPEGTPGGTPPFSMPERLNLQAERIGDYSIASCA